MNQFFLKHTLKPLGGLNNKNYFLSYYGKEYALRIPEKDNLNNFKDEHIVLKLINSFNLAPKVIYHNSDSGVLLTSYLSNANISFDTFTSKNFISCLAEHLKRLHVLKCEVNFNPFDEIKNNILFLRAQSYKFNHPINNYIKTLDTIENLYKNIPHIGLCHNDLNTSNMLFFNNQVLFIDFEFAGMGDIFFDLATLSWFLNEREKCLLLKSYFGHYNTPLLRKLENYLYVVKLWNATWSFKKSLTSTSDYDYKLGGNMILDHLRDFIIK